MARAVIWEKESFRAIQFTLLASRALKSWTFQIVRHLENLLRIETPLNIISGSQKYI